MEQKEATVQIIGRAIPFTKAEMQDAVEVLATKVSNGEVDPIATYTEVKALGEVIALFLKDKRVTEATISAVDYFGKLGAKYNGASLCTTETGVRYDFSACGDTRWNELAKQKAAIEEQLKEREKFLKAISGKQSIVDDETGELLTLYPPTKTSTTSVRVTFAK